MAIIVSAEEKRISWWVIGGVISFFAILLAVTYYLFFAPTPFIEVIVPPELKKHSAISEIKIDAASIRQITDAEITKRLRQHVAPPSLGSFGRENPFLSVETQSQSQ